MRCGFLKRAIWLLALLVPAVMSAEYTASVVYEGEGALYYAVRTATNQWAYDELGNTCFPVAGAGIELSTVTGRTIYFYTDDACQENLSDMKAQNIFQKGKNIILTLDKLAPVRMTPRIRKVLARTILQRVA